MFRRSIKLFNNAIPLRIAPSQLTPPQVVEELNRFIIGQMDAKKSVAVALRNRWRRQQIEGPMKEEIMPKNILVCFLSFLF